MRILSLDLAVRTGWAIGSPGAAPRCDVVRVKNPQQGVETGAEQMGRFIRDMCLIASDRPELIVYEAPLPVFDSHDERNGERTIRRSHESIVLPPMLAGAVHSIAACYGIDCFKVFPATIRKHFVGRANLGSRDATKRAVIDRCHLLGYLPRTDRDDNKADALALWDYAMAKWSRAAPRELHFFGEHA